ncbi:CheC, inhibitor of MCP methylation / FliN fusion protein [Ammonifex degensii KC4]|uniref:CheC, inhibitor of MCP methylation / FliN fusion protein n=1 Tax=Ammonifex degensii (strain DSM 10501 / KC4) TaxID=429009 RepID=C9R9W6_AMMDK|nr:flagellar motor switch phosphatase FliY [Ammonifex degensii]ACX53095.1 CheC, inhibitor of MCP methylation / FliN fusion protein [Ammonifex degensii KC4]
MKDEHFLSQEEIDALLKGFGASPDEGSGTAKENPELTEEEKDALGEIGNIAMGAAATALSEILGRRVTITSPHVQVTTKEELLKSFTVPYLIVSVPYTEGLEGLSLLVVKVEDASVIADLMMGGEGKRSPTLGEIEISAVAEAMNQMMGAAATSLADIYHRTVGIAPPQVRIFSKEGEAATNDLGVEDPIAVISFRMTIEDLLDTEIMRVLSVSTAKEEASLLWQGVYGEEEKREKPYSEKPSPAEEAAATAAPAVTPSSPAPPPLDVDRSRLELILDIPLKVSVVLGRTRRPIKEILGLGPGSILELDALADEPVEILVNGVLVARGEVVVVEENFGVRITSIVTPQERLRYLARPRKR